MRQLLVPLAIYLLLHAGLAASMPSKEELAINKATAKEPPNFSLNQARIPNYQQGTGNLYFYIISLLNLSLAQTEGQYGLITLKVNDELSSQSQQFESLTSGDLDVTWSITSQQREDISLPIRIPLMGGLFGYRVLLVNNIDSRFNQAPPLSTLKQMIAIQGEDWPDTTILRSNHFTVATGSYEDVFNRLKQSKADYFPRAAHEVFEELETALGKGLKVGQGVALTYPNPMFFFVSPHRPELAIRLKKGLEKLMKNGDLHRFLTAQHFYIQARNLLENRTIYSLENPLLSEQTRQIVADYNSPLKLINSSYPEVHTNEQEAQAPIEKQLVRPEFGY